MPKVVLIDGNSLAYRAFYALPDTMKTADGTVTNAVYGFTTMLLKVLEQKPDYVAIAFDLKGPTFRHKEYKEYKATRQKAPPTLNQQMPIVKEVVEAFDIPIYEVEGFEADDIIGTLAKEAEKEGLEVEIFTGDLDALQLVTDKIKVLSTRKGITDTVEYGPKEVKERYGLGPEKMIDLKALKGDASDNIPGVPKVGEKTAVDLLLAFGSLDGVYDNLDKIKKKALKASLEENKPLAELSRRLATIVTNVPIKIDFKQAKHTKIDWDKVLPVLEKLEFNSLVKKYGQKSEEYSLDKVLDRKREQIAQHDFNTIDDENKFQTLLEKLQKAKAFAFDLETTSIDAFNADLVGISFSTEKRQAYYIPLGHKKGKQLELKAVITELKPILESDQLKIGHNIKYDIEVLIKYGINVKQPLFDTMVAAYLLDPNTGRYALKKLGLQLGQQMIKLTELIGKDSEYNDFSEVPVDLATDYACSDADVTFELYEMYQEKLKNEGLFKLFEEVEMPLIDVLIEMEANGVSVDVELLKKMGKGIEAQLKDLERNIFAIAGETFNINSPKQLGEILFTKLMLPVLKKTKTGASTDAEVLEELAQRFEIAQKLLEYRQLTKLKSTYVDVLPELIDKKTNRIHTSFNQTITATGRLSSSNPNLQNVPPSVREAFVPKQPGWLILAADYSQIELRVLAHLSQDPALIDAFEHDKDVHAATAAEIFGVDEKAVTKDMRRTAKVVNFGIVYGMSDFGLAKSLRIKKAEAAEYIAKYFNRHTGVKKYMDDTIKQAKKDGFVLTLLGRKRPLPDINSPNYGLKSFAERTAINTPVQGTAADMIKVAMANISSKLKSQKSKSKLILQVHDELVFEVPKDELEKIIKIAKDEMIKALKLDVPIKVDIFSGNNWGEAK